MNTKSKKRFSTFIKSAGFPPHFYHVMSESREVLDFYAEPIRKAAIRFIESFRLIPIQKDDQEFDDWLKAMGKHTAQSVYIGGRSGTGKTILAAWLGYQIIIHKELRKGVMFANVPLWLEMLRPNKGFENENLFERTCNADLLILDDIGAEVLSQWVFERIYLILNFRRDNMLPTLVTSNFSLPELRARLLSNSTTNGDRLLARLGGFSEWGMEE